MSDEEVGWGSLTAPLGCLGSVDGSHSDPRLSRAVSISSQIPVLNEDVAVAAEDDEDVGWASVVADEAEAFFKAMEPDPSQSSGSGKKRGRPFGIKGSHAYRAELRAQLEEDRKAEAEAQKKSSRQQRLKKARSALQAQCQEQQSVALVCRAPSDAHPHVGTDLQRSLHDTAVQLVHNSLQPVPEQQDSAVQNHVGITSPAGCCRLSANFSPKQFLETLFKPDEGSMGKDTDNQNEGATGHVVLHHLFKPYRSYCSITRDSDAFNVAQTTFARTVIRSAAAMTLASAKLFGNMLAHIRTLLATTHEGILFLVNFRFDETPSKIKVSDCDAFNFPTDSKSGAGKSTQAPQQLAKILQTELSISALLRPKNGGSERSEHMLLSTYIPTPLQVLDRQTARNLKQALDASLAIPGLEEVAADFNHRAFLFCTDEFAANIPTQVGMQATRTGWWRMSVLCDIHKGSTVQGRVFELTGPAISAVINFALSMTAAGSIGKLQAALTSILMDRFELHVGTPQLSAEAERHKKEVLDLYLSVPSSFAVNTADSVSQRQKLRYSQRQKQRAIIDYWCNGSDFRNTLRIVHVAKPGIYQDAEQARDLFVKYMVAALIPCGCPVFPRSRWFGADQALDYCGLLLGVHGLLVPLIEKWTQKDIAAKLSASAPADSDCESAGWDLHSSENISKKALHPLLPTEADAEAAEATEAAEAEAQIVLADQEEREEGPQEPESMPADQRTGFDWHEYHQRLKTSVADWLLAGAKQIGPSCAAQISLMRQYMAPVLRMMTRLLNVSSKRWLRDELAKEAQGKGRQFRMCVAFNNLEAKQLIQETLRLLGTSPVALPEVDWRQDINVLCLTMLSRLACATHQLFTWRRQKYPYALFSALNSLDDAKAVFNDKRCCQDEVTQELCKLFPSEVAFASEGCLSMIQSIALVMETDIGAIERQHTIGRKIIASRSMARPVTLQTLSADFCLRQNSQRVTDSLSFYYIDGTRIKTKLKKRQAKRVRKNKTTKRRRGGGGGFRAFLSVTTKGKPATPTSWSDAAKAYRALDPAAKKFYAELVAVGTQSHRRGFSAFGKVQQKGNTALPNSEPSPAMPASRDGGQAASAASSSGAASSIDQPHGFQVAPFSSQLDCLDPEKVLKNSFKEIAARAAAISAQADAKREDALETFSKFWTGDHSIPGPGPRASLEALLPGAPGVGNASALLIKPSKLPWMEWVPPADIFAQAALGQGQGQGTGYGLLGKLEADWDEKHQVFYHAKAKPLPSRTGMDSQHVFRAKRCLDSGMCICSPDGKKALLFWQKLARAFRKIFKKKSAERAKLDAGMVVLQCDSSAGAQHFFHLGYINLKTYHFTLLALQPRGSPMVIDCEQVLPLCLDSSGNVMDVALRCFSQFDLDVGWKVCIRYLVQRTQRFLELPQMVPHHVEILFDESLQPDFAWQGWDSERPRRRARPRQGSKPEPKSGEQKSGAQMRSKEEKILPSSRSQPAQCPGEAPFPVDPSQLFMSGAAADADDKSEKGSYTPTSPLPDDFVPGEAASDEDSGSCFEELIGDRDDVSATSSGDESDGCCNEWMKAAGQWLELAEAEALFGEDERGVDDGGAENQEGERPCPPTSEAAEGEAAPSVDAHAPAAGESILLQNAANVGDDADVLKSPSARTNTSDISISSFSESPSRYMRKHGIREEDLERFSDLSGLSDVSSPSNAARPSAVRASSGLPRAEKVADSRFEVPPHGSIRYNHKQHNLVAHCSNHGNNCRRTRTVHPSVRNRGQGRPIGLLTSWLQKGCDFDDDKRHSAGCKPSQQERRAGRELFYSLEGGKDWAKQFERSRRDDEDSEPENLN